MPQYLVSGYLPDNFDPSTASEATVEEIHALNREMIAAGVRKFAGGLGPARTLRAQPNGELLLTDGPYLETKEHVGGFWILETASLDEVWRRGRAQGRQRRVPFRGRGARDFLHASPRKGLSGTAAASCAVSSSETRPAKDLMKRRKTSERWRQATAR